MLDLRRRLLALVDLLDGLLLLELLLLDSSGLHRLDLALLLLLCLLRVVCVKRRVESEWVRRPVGWSRDHRP